MTTSHEGFPAGDAGEGRSPLRRFRPCAGMTRIRFEGSPRRRSPRWCLSPLPGRPSEHTPHTGALCDWLSSECDRKNGFLHAVVGVDMPQFTKDIASARRSTSRNSLSARRKPACTVIQYMQNVNRRWIKLAAKSDCGYREVCYQKEHRLAWRYRSFFAVQQHRRQRSAIIAAGLLGAVPQAIATASGRRPFLNIFVGHRAGRVGRKHPTLDKRMPWP